MADEHANDAPGELGDDQPSDTPAPAPDADLTANDSSDDDGAGGKRAVLQDLAKERRRRQELEAELEEIRNAQLTDQERAIKEATDAGRAAALAEVNTKLFSAELRAASRGDITIAGEDGDTITVRLADPDLLADPEVAVRLLGLGEIPVTEAGDINAEAISTAVADLVTKKPYLASAMQAGAAQPPPDIGNGARGTKPNDGQLTRADLSKMTPEQVNEARKAGRLDDVLSGKS